MKTTLFIIGMLNLFVVTALTGQSLETISVKSGEKMFAEAETEASALELITATLMDYIEGTANGDPERIKRAFHSDLNLYTVEDDKLKTRNGQQYISYFEDGKKRNRIGSITAIDYENDAAMAKIKIVMPGMKRIYTDYLLLLKVEGAWKIIHKSYTFVESP